MGEELGMYEELATRVANPETDNPSEPQNKLATLTGQAMEMARSIVSKTLDVDPLWAKLLPVLHEVQSLLSKHCDRRQERRASNLPSWERWRRWFLRESGLNVSERTAQRRLQNFRKLMVPATEKTAGQSRGTTPAERYQGLLAQQAANQLFDTLFEGGDSTEAYDRYLAIRINPNRLRQMIASCPKPREANTIAAGNASSSNVLACGAISLRLHLPGLSSECEIDFRPGGWALLAEYISVEHREHFEAVFGTLSLAEKHQAFKDFTITIAKTLLHLDDDDNNRKLPCETVTEDREPLHFA